MYIVAEASSWKDVRMLLKHLGFPTITSWHPDLRHKEVWDAVERFIERQFHGGLVPSGRLHSIFGERGLKLFCSESYVTNLQSLADTFPGFRRASSAKTEETFVKRMEDIIKDMGGSLAVESFTFNNKQYMLAWKVK